MVDEEDRSFANPRDDLKTDATASGEAHQLGQPDNPEEEWGEAVEGAIYSANHARRGEKTEADREHGAKSRAAFKDQVSRRS